MFYRVSKIVCFCSKFTFIFFESSTNYRKKNQKYDFYAASIEISYIIL